MEMVDHIFLLIAVLKCNNADIYPLSSAKLFSGKELVGDHQKTAPKHFHLSQKFLQTQL
jgi:D-lyxose ketol-isomerase